MNLFEASAFIFTPCGLALGIKIGLKSGIVGVFFGAAIGGIVGYVASIAIAFLFLLLISISPKSVYDAYWKWRLRKDGPEGEDPDQNGNKRP